MGKLRSNNWETKETTALTRTGKTTTKTQQPTASMTATTMGKSWQQRWGNAATTARKQCQQQWHYDGEFMVTTMTNHCQQPRGSKGKKQIPEWRKKTAKIQQPTTEITSTRHVNERQ